MDKRIVTNLMIDYFKAVLTSSEPSNKYFATINKEATKSGFIVEPMACGEDNSDLLCGYFDTKRINTNSTFYKTWEDVISKSRFELFIDQCKHYTSTYGSDFEATAYVPNPDLGEPMDINWSEYVVIQSYSKSMYMDACMDAICSGIALNSGLVKDICNYIISYLEEEYTDEFILTDIISRIKNKEAKRYLMVKFNIKPKNGQELFEFLYTYITGDTLIIKNKASKCKIQAGVSSKLYNGDKILEGITDDDMKLLASVFYRYKPLFLSMKYGVMTKVVNKIRKYADKYHKPLNKGVLDDIFTFISNNKPDVILKGIVDQSRNVSVFKLISVLNYMYMCSTITPNNNYKMYRVRNGKSYIKECKVYDSSDERMQAKVDVAAAAIYNAIIEKIKKNAGVVRLPEFINLVCPTSEKNFIGDIPMNSYINMKDNYNIIGIYWRNEWGTRDYDLSALTDMGNRIGWNGAYKDGENRMVYSGDMTNADPEATELLYSNGKMDDCNIYVNRYSGQPNTKFNIFYGSSAITWLDKNHMVDAKDILFKADFTPEQNSFMVGRIINNVFYFTNMTTGNSRISTRDVEKSTHAINNLVKSSLNLKRLLIDAGFEIYDAEKHDKIDYDMSTPDKSILLKMFS